MASDRRPKRRTAALISLHRPGAVRRRTPVFNVKATREPLDLIASSCCALRETRRCIPAPVVARREDPRSRFFLI